MAKIVFFFPPTPPYSGCQARGRRCGADRRRANLAEVAHGAAVRRAGYATFGTRFPPIPTHSHQFPPIPRCLIRAAVYQACPHGLPVFRLNTLNAERFPIIFAVLRRFWLFCAVNDFAIFADLTHCRF